jgi:hypothetical protein
MHQPRVPLQFIHQPLAYLLLATILVASSTVVSDRSLARGDESTKTQWIHVGQRDNRRAVGLHAQRQLSSATR